MGTYSKYPALAKGSYHNKAWRDQLAFPAWILLSLLSAVTAQPPFTYFASADSANQGIDPRYRLPKGVATQENTFSLQDS